MSVWYIFVRNITIKSNNLKKMTHGHCNEILFFACEEFLVL